MANSAIIAGIIGSLTGGAGLIVSIAAYRQSVAAYRRTDAIKSLDLRMELRRGIVDLRNAINSATFLMDGADGSRKAVAAATGTSGSGRFKIFIEQLAWHRQELAQLAGQVPETNDDFAGLDASALEHHIVKVHALLSTVHGLCERYQGALARDDEQRRRITDKATLRRD